MKYKKILPTLSLFLGLIASLGVEKSSAELPAVEAPKFSQMLTNLPDDWALWGDETFSKENQPHFWALMALTGVLVATDYETWKESERLKNRTRDWEVWHWHGVSIGDGFFQFTLAGGIAGVGWISDDNRLLRTAAQIVEAAAATGAVVQLIKHFSGRESPFQSTSKTGEWVPFPEQSKYYVDVQKYDAVPSGHIATTWSTFKVIEANYPNQKWIPWVGYPVALLVAQGLVGTGLHWWSDIPMGIALGHQFARIVTRNNDKPAQASLIEKGEFKVFNGLGNTTMMGMEWSW